MISDKVSQRKWHLTQAKTMSEIQETKNQGERILFGVSMSIKKFEESNMSLSYPMARTQI